MAGFMDIYGVGASTAPPNFNGNTANLFNGGYGLGLSNPVSNPTPFNTAFASLNNPTTPQNLSWWDKIGGMQGLNQGISTFGNLANIYMGFKALGLAKDQFNFSKKTFNKNFNAQAQAYNNELRDRWESRSNAHATRGRDYTSMDKWMADRKIDKVGNERGS